VSPVLALSSEAIGANQEVERNIRELGDLICDHHPESKLDRSIAYQNMKERRRNFKDPSRMTQEDVDAMYRELEEEHKSFKDPFTFSPNGSVRQSADGKFRCIGFPKVRSWPECEKKFKEAKERTKRLFQSR
jgi:hypothetical protein